MEAIPAEHTTQDQQMMFVLSKLQLGPQANSAPNSNLNANGLPANVAAYREVTIEDVATDKSEKFAKQAELKPGSYWVHKDTYHYDDPRTGRKTPVEAKSAACTIGGAHTGLINYGNACQVLDKKEILAMAAKFVLETQGDLRRNKRFKLDCADPEFAMAVIAFCARSNCNIPTPDSPHAHLVTRAYLDEMDSYLQMPEIKKRITGVENTTLSKQEEIMKKEEKKSIEPPVVRPSGMAK
jgi:hypothetical protein